MTKAQRIIAVLGSGKAFSVKQLAALTRQGPNAVRARVSELRRDGYDITSTTTARGTFAYVL